MGPGEVLAGRFRIEEEAGAGAMGVVYRAVDSTSGEVVAVKVMQGHNHQGARFAREARVLARLEHPAIVRYVAHGTTERGAAYLAMQWLEGEDLDGRLKRGPLPLADAIALSRRVADALSTMHARGIVHRDLKPSNLFLPAGDVRQVTLLDFGIARVSDATIGMTASGAVVGTPGYMSPEQARGTDTVDARADVFALGCILWECIMGKRVFVGEHIMAVVVKILLEEPPRLRDLREGIPAALDDLVARMLIKDPAQRPPDGAAVRDALDDVEASIALAHTSVEERTSRKPPSLSRGERNIVSVVIAETPPVASARGTEILSSADVDLASLPDPTKKTESDELAVTMADDTSRMLVTDLAARFQARVEHLADGILVATLRGSGVATDQAAQAARCALAIRKAFPYAPIALATDRALVTGALPIGPVIDKSVGMLREAREGDPFKVPPIRLDEVTAGLLPSRFRLRASAIGTVLVEEEDVTDTPRTLLGKATPFVGRDQELGTLVGIFRHVENDSVARAAVVTGPPGFGKSRLRAELVRELRAVDSSPQIWTGVGDPLGARTPFGAVARAMRGAFGLLGGVTPDAELRRVRERVAGAVPAPHVERVATFIAELLGVPLGATGHVELAAARQDPALKAAQMQRAFIELLEHECAAGTLVLIFEDAHWVDPSTMKLIDAALRELADRQFFVVALGRPEIDDAFPTLWAERGVVRLALPPLPARASERLAARVLGRDAKDDLVRRIVQQAGGSPFFLEELLRSVAGGGGDAALPATVLAMVQTRIEGLDSESRRLLRAASVFGPVFWRGGASALLGTPEGALLEAWLSSLIEREFLVRQRESRVAEEVEYGFRHGLVRECAYLMLTDEDRILAHRLAADWLETAGERSPAVLAEHLERGGETLRAIDKYCQAVAHALEASDLESAIRVATHAISLGAEGGVRGRLRLLRAEAHRWRGEMDQAYSDARDATEDLERESADWYRAVAGAIAAGASTGQTDAPKELAEGLLQADAGDRLSRMMSLAQSATYLLGAGKLDIADRLLDALHASESILGDEIHSHPLLMARMTLAQAMRAHVSSDEALAADLMLRAAGYFQAAGDTQSACAARANAGLIYSFLGRFERSEALLTEALAMAQKSGALNTVAWIKQSLSTVFAEGGRPEDGLALAREASETAQEQKDRRLEAKSRIAEADILLSLGDGFSAEQSARRAIDLGDGGAEAVQAGALAALSSALATTGRQPESHGAALDLERLLEGGIELEETEAKVRLVVAESYWRVGEHEKARAAILRAKKVLLARAERLDAADREAFLKRVRVHARTLALAAEWTSN
jgi:serine/threonine protein kinase/tetratricopeptide (TPR) repeat protein